MTKTQETLDALKTTILSIEEKAAKLETRSTSDGRQFCFNIKVYDYLEESDVDFVCERLGVNEIQKELIKEEFDEDRFSSIFNHACDYEREYVFSNMFEFGLDSDHFHIEGKSGGWLVYTKLYSDYLDNDTNFPWEDIKKLEEVNLNFWRSLRAYELTARGIILRLEEDLEQAQNIEEQLTNLLKLGEHIKLVKLCFIDILIDNLEYEITTFLEEGDQVLTKYEIAKIDNNIVTTNKGAQCTLEEARAALIKLKAGLLQKGDKIGNYTFLKLFDFEGKQFAKVGCHKFLVSELEEKLLTLN